MFVFYAKININISTIEMTQGEHIGVLIVFILIVRTDSNRKVELRVEIST